MDNPLNRLITVAEVEDILNYFNGSADSKVRIQESSLPLYQRAFTNESYLVAVKKQLSDPSLLTTIYLSYIPTESNERLEFLGDSVLKLMMGHYLYERFPTEREGFCTTLKIKLENTKTLYRFGEMLGFKKFLLLSLQVENQTVIAKDWGRNAPCLYENAFEAFVGAVFEDLGYETTKTFVRGVIENLTDFSELNSKTDNYKDTLQQFFQARKWKPPVYTQGQRGPNKLFTCYITISLEQLHSFDETVQKKIKETYADVNGHSAADEFIIGMGTGKKIKDSEQDTANAALTVLNLQETF